MTTTPTGTAPLPPAPRHLRQWLGPLVKSVMLWPPAFKVLQVTAGKLVDFVRTERYERRRLEEEREWVRRFFPDLTVHHGPFKGLRYPAAEASCSTFLPKLLGSYEREVHPWVEAMVARPYRHVLNIGCAEGYYAVGMALRLPDARIHAFDVDEQAQQRTHRMAMTNGVQDRVTIAGWCSREFLSNFDFENAGLILCDCEGGEKDLFTPEVVARLAHVDVLVELHDQFDPHVSDAVLGAFAATHDHQVVGSVDDVQKSRTYQYPELSGLDISAVRTIVGEKRPGLMEWAWFTPKAANSASTTAL